MEALNSYINSIKTIKALNKILIKMESISAIQLDKTSVLNKPWLKDAANIELDLYLI